MSNHDPWIFEGFYEDRTDGSPDGWFQLNSFATADKAYEHIRWFLTTSSRPSYQYRIRHLSWTY